MKERNTRNFDGERLACFCKVSLIPSRLSFNLAQHGSLSTAALFTHLIIFMEKYQIGIIGTG